MIIQIKIKIPKYLNNIAQWQVLVKNIFKVQWCFTILCKKKYENKNETVRLSIF